MNMTNENGKVVGYDLFGQQILKQKVLRDDFIEPPFSVLDTKGANWINRKKNGNGLAFVLKLAEMQ